MKKLLIILPLFWALAVSGQKPQGIHQWMFRAQGTVALGLDINKYTPEQRYYIYGEGELLVSDHIGINGSAWYNLGSSERRFISFGAPDGAEDAKAHSILAGPVFHAFADHPLDLFLGIQPGFSLTTMKYNTPVDGVETEFQVSPTASVHGGVAYYGSFFHLFAQARYLRTQHYSIRNQQPLNDLRLCIGLGFNFN
ncbi:MAG TPA: hypothetical protein VHS96_06255 [Bacteroidia bacterium]|nr:hypothetical protein [Bacteroidia bacterium]